MANAELTLVMKARDMASGTVRELGGLVDEVGQNSDKTKSRFGKLGEMIDSIPFGRMARGLLDIVLSSKPVRDILQHIGSVIGERLAPVMAKLTAWVDAKLIPALVKLADIVGPILGKAIDVAAWAFEHVIIPAIETVIHIISVLLGKIGDAIGALQRLGAALGNAREQNRGHDPIGDLLFPPHAAGGWVGLHGPEIGVLGEKGPEYVVPNNKLGGMMPGYQAVAVSEKDIARMVDEKLYFTLRRAAPTSGRV